MARVVVIYHSGYGHTEVVALQVLVGLLAVPGVSATRMTVGEPDWDVLARADALVFGAPTYMGSVPAAFKQFMDDSSGIWFQRGWQDKLAAGFVNSGALGGDKQGVLQQLQTFAAQHGMHWLSCLLPSSGNGPDDINRLGASAGLMTQSDNADPALTPPWGDRRSAEQFGIQIGERVLRWCRGAVNAARVGDLGETTIQKSEDSAGSLLINLA